MSYSEHAEAIEEVMAQYNEVITWDNREWVMATTGAHTRRPLEAGGIAFDSDLVCVCATKQFTDAYSKTIEEITKRMAKSTIAYRGREYRIDGVKVLPGGVSLRIDCIDANRG